MGHSTIERASGRWCSMYSLLYDVQLIDGAGNRIRNFLKLKHEEFSPPNARCAGMSCPYDDAGTG